MLKQLLSNKYFWILAYATALCFGLLQHEMWRDEWQAWSIAQASHTLSDLWFNTRYEGHPMGWFCILWCLSNLGFSACSMQMVHGLFSLTLAVIVLWRSPFLFWQKILLLFGYFFLFEYGIICRNYLPGILLFFVAIHLIKSTRSKRSIWFGIVLLLMCQMNFYSLMLSVPLLLYYIWLNKKNLSDLVSLAMIYTIGLFVGFYSCLPPASSSFGQISSPLFLSASKFSSAIGSVWCAMVPLPIFWKNEIWNTHIPSANGLQLLGGLLFWVVAFLIFKKNKPVLLLYFLGSIILCLFAYAEYLGYNRHFGHQYIWFLGCAWLAYEEIKTLKVFKITFFTVLLFQFLAAEILYVEDFRKPFSSAQAAAIYIKSHFASEPIYGAEDAPLSALAGELGKPITFLNNSRTNTFVVWDSLRTFPTDSLLWSRIFQLADNDEPKLFVLTYHPWYQNEEVLLDANQSKVLSSNNGKNYKVTCIKSFVGSMVPDENYSIYRVIRE